MDSRPRLLLSIDFEDWHQLVNRRLGRADWDRARAEFPRHVHAVLDLLDRLGARATFFLLGMTVALAVAGAAPPSLAPAPIVSVPAFVLE